MAVVKDMQGLVFGRLTVTGDSGFRTKSGEVLWDCACACGGSSRIQGSTLRIKGIKSCGCLQKEKARELCLSRTTHGEARRGRHTPTYKVWRYMKDRLANDPDYVGVKVDPEWLSNYAKFLADVGEKPKGRRLTLDRVDNSLGYVPGNVRWATFKEQANNKTNNVLLTYKGKTLTLAEWSDLTGMPYSTLAQRVRVLGWSTEKAMETPWKVTTRGKNPRRPNEASATRLILEKFDEGTRTQ